MSEKLPRHPGYPRVDRWRQEIDDQVDVRCEEDAAVRARSLRPGVDLSAVSVVMAAYLTAASALVRARLNHRKMVPAWYWARDAFTHAQRRFGSALTAVGELLERQGARPDNPFAGGGPGTVDEYLADAPLEQVSSAEALVIRLTPGAGAALLSAVQALSQTAEALRATRVAEVTTRDPANAAIAAVEVAVRERDLGYAEATAACRPNRELYRQLFDPTRLKSVAALLLFPFVWLAQKLLPRRRDTRHIVLASLTIAALGTAGVEGYRLGKNAGCGKACIAPVVAAAAGVATATPAAVAAPSNNGRVDAIFGQVRNYDDREWKVTVECTTGRKETWVLQKAGAFSDGDRNSARLGYGHNGQFTCAATAEGGSGSCTLHGGDRCGIRGGVVAAEPY